MCALQLASLASVRGGCYSVGLVVPLALPKVRTPLPIIQRLITVKCCFCPSPIPDGKVYMCEPCWWLVPAKDRVQLYSMHARKQNVVSKLTSLIPKVEKARAEKLSHVKTNSKQRAQAPTENTLSSTPMGGASPRSATEGLGAESQPHVQMRGGSADAVAPANPDVSLRGDKLDQSGLLPQAGPVQTG